MENREGQVKRALEAVNETLYLMHNEAPVQTLNRIFMWIMGEYGKAFDSAEVVAAEEFLVEATALAIFVMQGDKDASNNVGKIALTCLEKTTTDDNAYKLASMAPAALANGHYEELFSILLGLAKYHGIDLPVRLINSCAAKQEYVKKHPTLFTGE